jgi:hypothetical protein
MTKLHAPSPGPASDDAAARAAGGGAPVECSPASPTAAPLPTAGYTLDRKLAAIARDRAVLGVLRTMADRGLQEGARVRHAITGASGRLYVARDAQPPCARVQLDGPAGRPWVEADDLGAWRRA